MAQNEFAKGQYTYTERLAQLYSQLQDELSKEIFWARLQCDVEPGMDRAIHLAQVGGAAQQTSWREEVAAAAAEGKQLVLYGAGSLGRGVANLLISSNVDYYAFCDKKRLGKHFWVSRCYPHRSSLAVQTSMPLLFQQRRIEMKFYIF